jgi:hypothetical protein
VTQLFTTLALRAAEKFGVERERVHLDSSSMAVEGQYVKDEASIHLVLVAGHKQISNLTPQRRKILQFLGAACGRYYLLE